MEWILVNLAPVLVLLVGMLLGLAVILLGTKRLPWQRRKKSPFTKNFLRVPGQTVYDQLDDLRMDILGYFLWMGVSPGMVLGVYGFQAMYIGKAASTFIWIFAAALILITLLVLGIRLFKGIKKIQLLRLGYEGEVAVGEELNLLMLHGYRVFHDFPADGYNIDHVIVGPNGVYAVETKARSKPDTGDGTKDARVEYDGKVLVFPNWTESKPLEQSRRQAQQLAKWLGSAVGEKMPVIPALALPGWFVDLKGRSDVLVFNGRYPEKAFPNYIGGHKLTPQQIQRVVHQLDAKCRDITPKAYTSK